MNKTVTINISGIIFHIDEDAYEKLSKYLGTIKGYFSKNESGNEIIADIEARIAELLQAKVNQFKQVILMADVDDVINALGKPEEFGIDEEEPESKNNASNTHSEPIKKRMFRDPDEKAIGGVCSGVAHYFDVDVVWIRLATFLLIFFGGVSLWVYIILWIVIPEAKTTTDKLAMRGEKINIDNISKSFKEEMNGVKSRVEKYGNEVTDSFKNAGKHSKTGVDRLAYMLTRIFMVFARLLGVFLIFIAIVILFALMSTFFGFSIAGKTAEYNDWINIIFLERSHYWLGFTGLLIAIGVPAFMLLYNGIKLLFKIKYNSFWLNISAGVIWFIGFVFVLYAGSKTASDFSEAGKLKEHSQINATETPITVSATGVAKLYEKYKIEGPSADKNNVHLGGQNSYLIAEMNNAKVLIGNPEVRILLSPSNVFEVVVNKKARGNTKRIATQRAGVINYNYTADSTGIELEDFFIVDKNEKFRVQEIEVIVKVPEGKTIFLDKSLANILSDADNVNDVYEQDMLSRKWLMTSQGLECVDCDNLEKKSNIRKHKNKKIVISEDGVEIKKKNSKITIDENGVKVKNEEQEED